jgi:hypothetical protein
MQYLVRRSKQMRATYTHGRLSPRLQRQLKHASLDWSASSHGAAQLEADVCVCLLLQDLVQRCLGFRV